jgi:hypothetical protein
VLAQFNDSLARLREIGYWRLLAGHGHPIADPRGRIDAILAAHEERTQTVRGLLDGLTTPASVSKTLFGDLPATETFAGMSEAIGHLDVLEERGEVAVREAGDGVTYERKPRISGTNYSKPPALLANSETIENPGTRSTVTTAATMMATYSPVG